ncbi:MAG TPA: hypothetical protein VKV26_24790 [Dehalococcoidia bacterium]|nr:hypothetical protein [Dehalococcoidia bacterium]
MQGSDHRRLRGWYHSGAHLPSPEGSGPGSPPRSRRQTVLALALLLLALWVAPLLTLGAVAGLAGADDEFNLVHWEVTRLAGFALNRLSASVAGRSATNAEVLRYFDLLRQARLARRAALAGDASATGRAADRQAQAERLRPRVETRFEDAVAGAARDAGLVERLPIFGGISFVWPPPAAGLTTPPHILVISPRDHIALESTQLLRSTLSDARAAQIERMAEQDGNDSALVDQIGGLSAWPSIVDQNDSPLGVLQTMAHEWMHAYLVFHPLGARYGRSGDLTLINETVANLVGRELGSAAYAGLGLPPPAPDASTTSPKAVDFTQTMHDLRLQVDALLAQGKIDEAEQRMNETQQLLAANGYAIRRINQAYFAFYGSYGDSPQASSPLGGEIETLRKANPSLAAFVHRVQNVASRADLERLLRAAR